MKRVCSTFACVALMAIVPTWADGGWDVSQNDSWCDDGGNREAYCEVRTLMIDSGAGAIVVDDLHNGGIRVEGWDRNSIEIRAKVQLWDRYGEPSHARDVRIDVDGTRLSADGPSGIKGSGWSVSFRLMVPRYSDLELSTHNGGIAIREVDGQIRFRTHNGGVKLTGLSGEVQGRTQNGGLRVQLDGRGWRGEGLDVLTQNGGIRVDIPEGYAADFTTGTTNGRLEVDFPVTVKGEIGRRLDLKLNGGGAPVRIMTTNGGVELRER